jgi:hypothetical protein
MLPPSVLPDISLTRGEIGYSPKLLISPLVGEMSGRTEGGAKVRELAHERPGGSLHQRPRA